MELEKKLEHYRISTDEYKMICDQLGREPQGVEWALYSALWSEHCSYKTSKVHLKKFYNQSERVLESFGENAGVIDLGEGERVAFKMESHNHPSYIEPYQGAATGVGGILRDIFTMGARPVALGNYLCFGEPQAERMSLLVDGVVRGISGYGNCVGVPTITGQTEFDKSYNGNILVNALALGLFRPGEKIFTSKAAGPGNYVVYVGAKTGRDGVHGASMASESFDDDSESKRPTVQIGDPFFEKLLIESCIEVMKKDLVVAIQDMGAAGLTSSSFEMAAKGGVGFEIHLDKVPVRDSTITPEEILLSESQERMLLICEPKNFEALAEVFRRWDLDAEIVGEVIAESEVRLHWHGENIAAIDPKILVDDVPQYNRKYNAWEPLNRVKMDSYMGLDGNDPGETLLKTLLNVRGTSRRWIHRQYDQRVGGSTVRDSGDSVAILRLPDSGRPLGLVLGCRPYMMRFDPREGGRDSVLYPALELSAKGLEPLAITDCLNFGNPEKPEVMSEFVAGVEGMSEACEKLHTPVISGNVSFYNETLEKNVTSTPSTGVVGLGSKEHPIPQSFFSADSDEIYLLHCHQLVTTGQAAEILDQDLVGEGELNTEAVAKFCRSVREVVNEAKPSSTRLVGKFGLAYALARMAIHGVGCTVESVGERLKDPGDLFKEYNYEVIVTVSGGEKQKFEELLQAKGIEFLDLGKTGGEEVKINSWLHLPVDEVNGAYNNSWEKNFEDLA